MGTAARTPGTQTAAVVITRWERGNENHAPHPGTIMTGQQGKWQVWHGQRMAVPAQRVPVIPPPPPPPPPLTSDPGDFPAQLREEETGPGSRLPSRPVRSLPPSHRSPAQPDHPSLPLTLTAACPLTSPWCQRLLSLADNCSHPHLGLLSAPGWGQVTWQGRTLLGI